MSAQVTISSLPAAGAITGSELVPVVQNGVTVQTTTGAIAASPSQTQTFLTVNQEPTLPNSRYVGVTNGLSITDGGAQGLFNISTTGALLSLVNSGTGFQVKTSSTAITGRSIAVTGSGLSISNGDGIAGNPTIGLSGQVLSLANLSANGLMTITTGGVLNATYIQGTANQIGVLNGDGVSGYPTISIVDNAVFPGTGGVVLPNGTNAQQPVGAEGQVRYNTDTDRFEGYSNGTWVDFGIGDGTVISVAGTANQINVVNGTTNPVVSLAANPIVPGEGSITVPIGSTGLRPVGVNGMLRYNTDIALFEGYINNSWQVIAAGSGVTSITAGTGLSGGIITSTGTIAIADTAVTAGSYGSSTQVGTFTVNAQGQLTAAANVSITPASIGAISSVSGTANEITATTVGTAVTVSLPSALTFTSKTITGGSYTGATIDNTSIGATTASSGAFTTLTASSSASVAGDTVATLTAAQTLTNKSMSGSSNTFTNIPNNALTNSQITLGTTNIALGGTSLAPVGLTSVTVTQDPTTNFQLATKQYVDTLAASGIHYHEPVYVESPNTAGNLNATYNQPGGAGDGVGATLTNAGTQVALTIDGVLTTVGMRVLIYNQTNAVQNGVYTVTVVGDASTNWVLTRATDADTYSPFSANALGQGDAFFVQAGATGIGETYICNTVGTIVFGTTNITFAQISTSQVYSAGTGLTLTGTQFSISNTAVTAGAYGSATQVGTFTVNAQGQLTLAGNTTVTPAVGSITGLGTGVATALAVNVGSSGAVVVNGGALGTPSSGTVTNLTGTASININGTVGATTANSGAFTTISATSVITSTVATGTAPFTVASTTEVANLNAATAGTATNATNTAITANSTNATNYLTFVSATSGNLGQLVNSSITCNPSTGALTGGISGGTF